MLLATGSIVSAAEPAPITLATQDFPLQDVRLLDGPFHQAMELDQAYLMALDPDRLLAGFRTNAGLPEKAKVYGGWESRGISGQTLGHYLSALSHMVASTGEVKFRDRLSYCLDELAACQAQSADGFIGGMPRGVAMFQEIATGDIRLKGGFDLNGGWVPWYNQHKLFAGLRDAYQFGGNQKAKTVLIKLGDWAVGVCRHLTDAQMQQMLSVEQGGMNEELANLFAITGDRKYLDLAERFWQRAVLDPLSQGQDDLTGRHANTNIPKVIGAARLYELTGNPTYKTTAETFWNAVTQYRSFVTGSNSDREHFFALGLEASKLGPQNGESCNVYNMLKLTAHLASWNGSATDDASLWDFYERALFNHILGSIDPNTGMCTYFQSLEPGRFKVYGSPTESFWCCTGTGLENHAKYGEHIYTHDADSLTVNLFIASELTWKYKGVTLRQETDFPNSDTTTLTIHTTQPTKLAIKIRVPGWAESGITVSGAVTTSAAAGTGYLSIDREWKDGNTLTVKLPMTLRLHRAIDDPTMVAIVDGPIVLAAELGRDDFPATDNVPDHTVYDHRPVPHVPAIVTEDASLGWLKPVPSKPLHFVTAGVGQPADIELSPYYAIHHQRYAVYLRMVSPAQYADMQKKQADEEAAKRDLESRTIDEITFGEQQPEQDHAVISDKSHVGNASGRPWRDATDGGSFSAKMKVAPGTTNVLRCTYWGSDTGNRVFDIIADGTVIATEQLTGAHPDQFFEVEYELPASLLANKDSIRIEFRAHPGAIAGGVFGCRVMQSKPQQNLLQSGPSH